MLTPLFVLLARVRGWIFRTQESADLDTEVEMHLSMLADDLERQGLSREEAARRARLAFGGVTQFKEEQRDRRGLPFVDSLVQDVRYALRLFRREPTFTAGAVLTLAIGIGANTAVFSLLNGYLRPLPVPSPSEIVTIGAEVRGDENGLRFTFSYPALRDLRARPLPFADIFAYTPWIGGLQADGRVSSFLFSGVTDNFFSGLRLDPAAGRLFARGEGEHPGSPRLLVLGYSCWQRRFAGDPHVVGKTVRINGQAATIIGVVPKTFLGLYSGTEMDGYITIGTLSTLDFSRGSDLFVDREAHMFTVLARVKPGVTIAQAQQAVEVAAAEIEREHPEAELNRSMRVYPERMARPFPQRVLSNVVPVITAFVLGLAGLVLMLACMNVANLLFVRALSRQREMAVRAALGASRRRLVRQSLTESLLLALTGGVAGVALGLLGQRFFVAGIDIGTDFPFAVNFAFDWRVFAYAMLAMLVTGVTVGVWPALRASRTNPSTMLHDGGRSYSGGGRQPVRRLLVVAQVAGALMLLIIAGLFVRHLQRVKQLDLGFETTHVLNARLDPHQAGYNDARTSAFYRQLEERVRRWPEVKSASFAFSVPIGYFSLSDAIYVDGRPVPPGELPPSVNFNRIDGDYFATMQIPVLEGRVFREADNAPDAHVAIVNRTMADRFWPGRSPIGQHVRFGKPNAPATEIVGVVRDAKYVLIFEEPRPYLYVPVDQSTDSMRVLQLRTTVPPASLGPRLEREIHALDPDVPIADLQTMEASLSGAMGFLLYRLGAYQATAMGALGLALAMIGIYGVVSFSASQRTREIGIRVALGAHPGDIARLILRQGVLLVLGGTVAGVVGAAALTRVMGRFFMMPHASNVPTVAGITLLLAALALWACWIPARRAMKVDPMVALRHE
jgi:predicted permease